jgi:Flp pilus assembly protein TadG
MLKRSVGFARRMSQDEAGAVLIYVSIALTVFMGFAALVIDGGRLFTLDTEMQQAADALALAGAAELDGNSDAITRAGRAMNNLVSNSQTFGNGSKTITGYSATYLTELPADSASIATVKTFATTTSTNARFVLVELTGANGRSMSTMFATAINGGATVNTSASAIAGFTSAVCKFTPLFICNPYEGTGQDFLTKVNDPAEQKKIYALKKSGSGASLAPGNFGFLDTGATGTTFKDSLGKVDPGACFKQTGVSTKTGSVDSARQPLNTRFDLYDGSYNNNKNDADFRPARNVTKGYMPQGNGNGGACNQSPDATKAMGFPLDSAIGSNRLGNGVWDFDTYWSKNHPGLSKPNSWNNSNLPSRYQVYRWEIDNSHIPNNSPTGENGNPTCSGQKNNVSDNPDRRIIYGAVMNCQAAGLKGGSQSNLPTIAFIKMFMTQPMTKLPGTGQIDEDDTLYVEMLGTVKPGTDDAVIHDIVQLYR